MKHLVIIYLITLLPWCPFARSAYAQFGFGSGTIVFDPTNLVQNVLQVQRMIDEIKLTTEQLQNMLLNTQHGATPWESQLALLLRLGNLLQRGQAIGYTVQNIDQRFLTTFPYYQPPANWHTQYATGINTSLDTLRNVLASLGVQAESIAWDASRISALQSANVSAVGRMAAIQAGNSIALETVGRLQRLEQIAMGQSNAYAAVEGQKLSDAAAREATARQFLLNGVRTIPAYGSSGQGINNFGLR